MLSLQRLFLRGGGSVRRRVVLEGARAFSQLPFRGTAREEVQDLLGLRRYDDTEIRKAFNNLRHTNHDEKHATIDLPQGLQNLVLEKEKKLAALPAQSSKQLSDKDLLRHLQSLQHSLLGANGDRLDVRNMDLPTFQRLVLAFGEQLDSRIWSVAASYLCVGLSVGVIIPCMTLLVSELNLSPSTYGLVVSSFALSKLLGNVPAALLVEKHGRKPVMLGGVALSGLSLAAVSMAFLPGFGAEWLLFCRFMGGFGVAAFVAGGNMFMSDVSTALNRTRTISPVMASFSAGTALGPALGGVLVTAVGLSQSYLMVGGAYAAVALLGQATIHETAVSRATVLRNKQLHVPAGADDQRSGATVLQSFKEAMSSWKELLQSKTMKDIIALQSLSSFVASGAQFTLLPLLMVSETVSLTPSQIAMCFTLHSVGALLASQPVAILADKIGKHRILMAGGALMSLSAATVPFASSFTELMLAMSPMAVANATLSSAPTALIADLSSQKQRAQAMSLLRTAGDVGLLTGAIAAGLVATHASISAAFLGDAAVMSAVSLWFVSKYATVSRLSRHDVHPPP